MPSTRAIVPGGHYGYLTVLEHEGHFAPPTPTKQARGYSRGNPMVLVRCECGWTGLKDTRAVLVGSVKSCGYECPLKEVRRQARSHPLYQLWRRVRDARKNGFPLLPAWESFEGFKADIEYFLPKPDDSLLPLPTSHWVMSRKDATKPYTPDNMEWISTAELASRARKAQINAN